MSLGHNELTPSVLIFEGGNFEPIMFLWFLQTEIVHVLEIIPHERQDLFILHSENQGCWWPGNARSQGISSHGIGLIHLECANIHKTMVMPAGDQAAIWSRASAEPNPELLHSWWPCDTISHRSRSTLANVMACCLTAPSHYRNQCWHIKGVLWYSPESYFIRSAHKRNP